MATVSQTQADFNSLSAADRLTFTKWLLQQLTLAEKENVVDDFYANYGVYITMTDPAGTTAEAQFVRPIQPGHGPRFL